MNKLSALFAVAATLLFAAVVRGQDSPRPFQGLSDIGSLRPASTTNSPFSRGLGQTVSGWTHDGIHGQELAERIHWLQQSRRGDNDGLPSFRDRDDMWRRDGDGRWWRDRDIREDRREVRDDVNRLRDDDRRIARDRDE